MQHEISDALPGDAEVFRERPREHGVLVDVERLDALVRWVRQPPVHLVDDQEHLAVVPVVVRLEDRREPRELAAVEHVAARVAR